MLAHRIRKKQLKFLGHIIRKEGLENLTLTGHIEGKRDGINSNLHNKLMNMDSRTWTGRDGDNTKLTKS